MTKEILLVSSVDDDRRAFQLMQNAEVLGLDSETSGIHFKQERLWSVQVSDGNVAALYVFNGQKKEYPFLKRLLKSEAVKVMHNASFDIKFLKEYGYTVNNPYCSQVAEQTLEAGKVQRGFFGLKDTLERYLNVKLDKTVRKDFYAVYSKNPSTKNPLGVMNENYFGLRKEWTPELVQYACDDVFYLPELYKLQMEKAKRTGLSKTLWLEQQLVPETALMEYRGVRIDLEALAQFENQMKGQARVYEQKVKEALLPAWKEAFEKDFAEKRAAWEAWAESYGEAKKVHNQKDGRRLTLEAKAARDAVKKEEPKKPVWMDDFNIEAIEQVKFALAANGIVLENLQKDNLQDFAGQFPVVDDFLHYNKFSKLAEFCMIGNKTVNSVVHPSFKQGGTESGRYSSADPNGQNIPARTEEGKQLRACFVPRIGNVFASADYAAIELVIIGVLSKDEKLLQALREGRDLHVWTMSYFTECSYDALLAVRKGKASAVQVEEVDEARESFADVMPLPGLVGLEGTAWVDTLRDYIKTLVYGIAYGLSSFGLARKFKCSKEMGQTFIDRFFEIYPKIKAFLDEQAVLGVANQVSVNINGRRRYFQIPKIPRRGTCSDLLYQMSVEAWRKAKGRVSRQASNFAIQSVSADITKLAILKVGSKLRANSFPENEGLILTIHDELILEVHESRAALACTLLQQAMQEAAYQILGDAVLIEVKPKITNCWEK